MLALYHRGQTTVARLVALLGDLGVLISKRQVMRLLNDAGGHFGGEAAAVLEAGLKSAAWISVDDNKLSYIPRQDPSREAIVQPSWYQQLRDGR